MLFTSALADALDETEYRWSALDAQEKARFENRASSLRIAQPIAAMRSSVVCSQYL
jgi:hypothetical protein